MELTIRLGIALVILICANVALGSINSWYLETFNKEKLWKGIKKGAAVIVIFMAVYTSGMLVPEVEATLVEGESVNLTTAMRYVVMAGFLWYTKEVMTKLASLISGKIKFK